MSLRCGATLSRLYFIFLLPAPATLPPCLVHAASAISCYQSIQSSAVPPSPSQLSSNTYNFTSILRHLVTPNLSPLPKPIDELPLLLATDCPSIGVGLWNHSLCIPPSQSPSIMSVILCTGMACLVPVYLVDAVMPPEPLSLVSLLPS